MRILFSVILAAMLLSAGLAAAPAAADPATPTWGSIGVDTHAEFVTSSNDLLGRQIAIAPADPLTLAWGNPRRLAYCASGGIQRTVDGGLSWSAVPTDAVVGLAASTPYPLATRAGATPTCQSVTLDRTSPDAFFAVFGGVKAPQDAPPPWFAVGYYTRDAGQTWQAVPAPSDTALQFRGFVSDATGVQALYAGPPSGPNRDAVAPVVSRSTDAGQTWAEGPFACPAFGLCVQFGEPPTGIGSCNMHGYPQPLLVSADNGQTWSEPSGAPSVNACQPNELAILNETDVLLLAPGADELTGDANPARLSRDGGRTFVPLTLPTGPDPLGPFEMKLLPDGRVLALFSGQTWSWQLLEPAEDHWCATTGALLPPMPVPITVAADQIWWLEGGSPKSQPYADIACSMPIVATPTVAPVP